MTGYEFVEYIRFKTRTNSTTFTDLEIIALANVKLDVIAREVLKTDEDIFVLPMTTNLIAGLREYPFPSSILSRIKYVEAKLDGTHYIPIHEFDLNALNKPTDETNILSHFGNEEGRALFDINRKSIVLYSGVITDVASGLKLWCNIYPAPLNLTRISDPVTDLSVDPTTTTSGFPRELHELWARSIIIDYKQSREKPIPLTDTEMSYKIDLTTAILSLKPSNMDRKVYATIPPACDRGNNGMDY
jgi:hypothetical protein